MANEQTFSFSKRLFNSFRLTYHIFKRIVLSNEDQ